MTFEVISPDEARAMYRRATHKKQMIQTLCDLMLGSREEIMDLLDIPIPKEAPKKGKIVHEECLKLWKDGLTDGMIARKIGVNRRAVTYWRNSNNLPVNFQRKELDFEELYREGLSDRAIAERVGCGKSSVSRWRNKNNLPVNK